MTEVASLALCQALFSLSGWEDCHSCWVEVIEWNQDLPKPGNYTVCGYGDSRYTREIAPAYDLGYLLRKLPRRIVVKDIEYTLRMPLPFNDWRFDYWSTAEAQRPFDNGNGDNLIVVADSPEDAACKMAIELFKKGILTKH